MQHIDDEFVSNLRPDSIFGAVGASDYFEEEDQHASQQEVQYSEARPYPNAVGSSPVAVSGAPVANADTSSSLGAAITLFCILGGAGLGWYYGGFKGAAGGAIFGGALRNMYRAQRTFSAGGDTLGAVKQGAIGAVGLAGGGYLLWTARK